MGKFANQSNWEQFKPLANAPEYYEEPEPPVILDDDELAQLGSEAYWTRLDATADELAEARRGYARPVCRVSLWDEAPIRSVFSHVGVR
ncbi:hypothetical protein [Paraburkholderia gardini]|uniref:hypothetical protein n=1 Tax=Paraburkholderia gardini TaxID=2823469 RepID=UPI001D758E10|nr:hypothetical protein [Paraburkholderia gardini]CAG4889528.1 hypothetical protein R69919_00765 [Paraburkholderia gardini]